MVTASHNPTARNMAAEMAANLPSGGGSSSDSGYEINGFAPTAAQVTQGESVQFVTTVTNNYGDSREVQLFVKLDGTVVATETAWISAGETRDVARTKSYSDLTTAVGSDGEYTLSVEAFWVDGAESLTQTWGPLTLGATDDSDSGDDGSNDDGSSNDGDDTSDSPVQGIPKQYLYAGGGAFAFLFLLVLVA